MTPGTMPKTMVATTVRPMATDSEPVMGTGVSSPSGTGLNHISLATLA